jgi:hypothetical protein
MVCGGGETEKKYPWPWMRAWQIAFFAKWGWASVVNSKKREKNFSRAWHED